MQTRNYFKILVLFSFVFCSVKLSAWELMFSFPMREWTKQNGDKITAKWVNVSQDSKTIWLTPEKGKPLKFNVTDFSEYDGNYISANIKSFKDKGLCWYGGVYISPEKYAEKKREEGYVEKAKQMIQKKSILGMKDLEVFQAVKEGALCRYGKLNNGIVESEGNIVFWYNDVKRALADHDILTFKKMYWAGTRTYENMKGVMTTVPCYTEDYKYALYLVRLNLELFDRGDKRFTGGNGYFNGGNTPPKNPDQSVLLGFGSGFFVTTNGYLVTNYHVVKNGDKYSASTDKGDLSLSLIGYDDQTDLALMKAEGYFHALSLSKKPTEKLGSSVFAVGFPMPEDQGYSPKVTKGVISSIKGFKDNPREYQIDAAIQPGNSGGPICNERGEVIAVVVAKLSDTYFLINEGTVPQNVNYGIKKIYLEAFLANYEKCAEELSVSEGKVIDFQETVEQTSKACALIKVYKKQ